MNHEQTKVSAADLVKLYQAFHPGESFTSEDIYSWGLSRGYDTTPDVDPKAAALRKIKRAVKQATFVDPQGRKVPQYIYTGDEEGQIPLWSELSLTPQPVVQRSLDMSRNKGIQTFVTSTIIAESYNENFNLGDPVAVDLNISDAVAEQVIIRRNTGMAGDDFDGNDQ
jgi:hypothetical protein